MEELVIKSPLVLDLEVKDTLRNKKRDPSPFLKSNCLVSAGWIPISSQETSKVEYRFFAHKDPIEYDVQQAGKDLQDALDSCSLLIGHNIKFDLQWLREVGFAYDGPVYDTMLGEYLIARGQKIDLSLKGSCIRRNTEHQKSDVVEKLWDDGLTFYEIPQNLILEYGCLDVLACRDLYLVQCDLYATSDAGLKPTLDMCNEFLSVLTQMEADGICIDIAELDKVEKEYKAEKEKLQEELNAQVYELMGDTPINLSSPEQLSWVIYSRKVIDKHRWAEIFNLGKNTRGKPLPRPKLSGEKFGKLIRANTEVLRKTKAIRCDTCSGNRYIQKFKVDGGAYKKQSTCPTCSGRGVYYLETQPVAGLKCIPKSTADVAAHGFCTDGDTISELSRNATGVAASLLTKLKRLSQIETYLSSFVDGIRKGIRDDGLLHAKFNQCVTATGRLSSSEPNFQNQPRAKTFPIRRVVVSRWANAGGCILEGDFAQLEFRVAGELAQDEQVLKDLHSKHDVHSYTSETLTKAGQETDRQDAKPHTFKPLYGGTSGTDAEQTYYKAFLQRYSRIGEWHEELLDAAVCTRIIKIPSGREYSFPIARRNYYGSVTGSTQIKNYPVQGFATADIVPIACIRFAKSLKEYKLRSLFINTVHDSLVADCFPGEFEIISRLMREAMLGVVEDMRRRYSYDFKFPLAFEIKAGPNWLDMKEVKI